MKNAIKALIEEFDFPKESHPIILAAYDKIFACEAAASAISAHLKDFEQTNDAKPICKRDTLGEVCEAAGVHPFEGSLVIILMLAVGLRKRYAEAGYTEEMYGGVVADIRYKLIECKLVKGIWGTFVSPWFAGFMELDRFCLGRLQFEIREFKHEYSKGSLLLTPESKVINVHIPRTGGRLDPESARASFAEAAVFFKERFGVDPIFVCHSWLLFPEHERILKPESNLRAFYNCFDIIEVGYYDDYSEVWRLFDTEYNPDHSKLPADSSLRRAYIDMMNKGEKTGWGYGVYPFK